MDEQLQARLRLMDINTQGINNALAMERERVTELTGELENQKKLAVMLQNDINGLRQQLAMIMNNR